MYLSSNTGRIRLPKLPLTIKIGTNPFFVANFFNTNMLTLTNKYSYREESLLLAFPVNKNCFYFLVLQFHLRVTDC